MNQTAECQSQEPITAPAEARRSWWNRDWLLGLLLIIATLMAYQPAWHGQRLWDDDAHLTQPELRSLNGLGRIWTDVGATQQYYPLSFSAFWVQHRLWGDSTLGYHLANVLLHCFSALLFLTILRRLEVPGAWLAAAIFALHPVHVESVAWMSQLKNTLSGLLYLSSALAYLSFDRTRKKGLYALALGLFVMGLLSKTAVVTLPAAMLVIFWWKRGRLAWKQDALPLVPFFLAGLAAGLFTVWLERGLYGARGAEFEFPFLERCLIAGHAIWFHLGKLLWPANLLFIYPRWQISQTAWPQYLYPVAALTLMAGLWRLRHWSRAPLAALLLFIGTLFPTLGFFNVCTFRYTFVNDHHQYLASLGIIALVAAGVTKAYKTVQKTVQSPESKVQSLPSPRPHRMERGRSFLRMAFCGALVLTLGVLAWRQARIYVDRGTLWGITAARNPLCYLAHANLGSLLYEQGRVDEAIARFRKALDIRPDFAETHNDLGLALFQKAKTDEALAHYEQALKTSPSHTEAHVNLGNALFQKAQMDEAIAHYLTALAIQPRNGMIYLNVGNALFQQGKLDEAIDYLQKGLALLPTSAIAHDLLGTVLLQKGQVDEAISHFQQALQNQPDLSGVHKNLASALVQKGQLDEAIAELAAELRASPNDSATHCYLAGVLGSQGRTKEAIAHYRAALKTRPEFPEALNNLAWILAANADPQVRSGPEAVALAERACRLTDSKQAVMVGTLAAAYAEAGRFAEALTTAEKAALLAEQANQPELAARNRKLIELYRARKPYHEPAAL
jgi:tetratricopeptide (TPR) repeat protein